MRESPTKKQEPYFSFTSDPKPIPPTEEHPDVQRMHEVMDQVEADAIEKTDEMPEEAAEVAARAIRKKNGLLSSKLRELVRSWRKADSESAVEPEPCPSLK